MTDDIALLLCKMMVGHGRLLSGSDLDVLSEYQKLCHLLSLASVVRFKIESTRNSFLTPPHPSIRCLYWVDGAFTLILRCQPIDCSVFGAP